MATHTVEPVIDRWGGGACPFAAGWRKVMMWAFIVTDGLLFAGFLASYGYARLMAERWPPQQEVFSISYLAVMTFVLISSSATMASAVVAAGASDRRATTRFVLLTILGGVAFLGMQAYEWAHLIGEGATLTHNPWGDPSFGSYFFLLTGFHGSHVLTGLIVLCVTAWHSAGGRSSANGVEIAGLYWHFVDLVWVFIFTLFYLV
ncbi:MAG: cytochrome c oxidase subunit 3 [Vicinamibacterales bacterium]|nr:cytochrome c oxidase subunit 3 [Vicinamibacterales bacterium]